MESDTVPYQVWCFASQYSVADEKVAAAAVDDDDDNDDDWYGEILIPESSSHNTNTNSVTSD